MQRVSLAMVLVAFVLAACGDIAAKPEATVQRYLEAKVTSNQKQISNLICSEMESAIPREVGSFANVSARLDNAVCTREGTTDIVACTGAILATYGNEDTAFPLSRYRVVQEDGEWRWCGEAR